MPRRNQRESHVPLDLTPFQPPKPDTHRERQLRQHHARLRNGIDWSVCIVPACGFPAYFQSANHRRNARLDIALCLEHTLVAASAVRSSREEPEVLAAQAHLEQLWEERRQAEHDRVKAAHMARTDGHMYFVRLNDLIKVGWTRDLYQRLKQYGASVEVLAHYPATRDDETLLHRNLAPARAKGREWYHDGPILQRYIAEAVAQHGPPTAQAWWSTPKP